VRVEAAAVCGSDLHLQDFGAPPPVIPGHEASGGVVELGKDVAGIEPGDRVVMDPVQVCGRCWSCRNGIEHLCLHTRHLGSGSAAGTWAQRVAVDARNLYRIPEAVGFRAGDLSEPAAVCCESFQRAGLREGDAVLVIGDGPFGFLHAQIAAALGAGKIICAGHHERRLERIRERTGALICNTRREDLQERVRREIPAPGVDVAVEASGSGAAPMSGLKLLRPRGTLVVFSYIWKPEALDMGLIHMKELNVLGSCRSHHTFGPCLELMADGKIDTETLVDLAVPIDNFREALRTLKADKANTFKVVFELGL